MALRSGLVICHFVSHFPKLNNFMRMGHVGTFWKTVALMATRQSSAGNPLGPLLKVQAVANTL